MDSWRPAWCFIPTCSTTSPGCRTSRPRFESNDHSLQCDRRDAGFNPRSREGSDTSKGYAVSAYNRFQSTLPRGERPTNSSSGSSRCPVSIHAPARGATEVTGENWSPDRVSIHAPARGATCPVDIAVIGLDFVSIHAPARGATS